jgi:hypothetical protein
MAIDSTKDKVVGAILSDDYFGEVDEALFN